MFKKIFMLSLCFFAVAQAAFKVSGNPTRLMGDPQQPFMRPLWSTDGQYIACSGAQYRGLWVVRVQDNELRQLSDEPAAGFGFTWSQDGKALVTRVAKYENERRYHAIKLFEVETQTSRILCPYQTRALGLPVWNFDNSRVYAVNADQLQSWATGKINTALKKQAPQNLSYLNNDQLFFYSIAAATSTARLQDQRVINLTTSPDGRRIAFEVMGGPLCVMNSDGTGYTELGEGHRPQWSPDNQYLVYMVTRDDGHEYTASDLYIIKADGSEKQALTVTTTQLEMNPSWSPSGDRIAYDDLGDGALYVITLTRN